jgi:UDP-N-acetylmuramate dehydrogenase
MSSLRNFTTMKVGGDPECLIELKKTPHPIWAELPRPIRILGNGSNTLIDDVGLKGTVVVTRDSGLADPAILETSEKGVHVRASSGIFLPRLCRWAARQGLTGLEYMIGVPGTLGGAVVLNAGANGQEAKDSVMAVRGIDLQTGQPFEWVAKDLDWSYRHSRFCHSPDQYWIESVDLLLQPLDSALVDARIEENLLYRKTKTPYQKPSLGSVFTRLPHGDQWYYPGQLIEEVGLKGHRIGDAQVSDVHANYIVNVGQARFEDVIALIKLIENKVLSEKGLTMRREILIWTDRSMI